MLQLRFDHTPGMTPLRIVDQLFQRHDRAVGEQPPYLGLIGTG